MKYGRYFWKLLTANLVLVTWTVIACLWVLAEPEGRSAPGSTRWSVVLVPIFLSIAIALGFAMFFSRRITQLADRAQGLAQGDTEAAIRGAGLDEVGAIEQSLEQLRGRLAQQEAATAAQTNFAERLLSQLHEGVILADPRGRIVMINEAARRLLGAEENGWNGGEAQSVEEVIPHHDIQKVLLAPTQDGSPAQHDSTWQATPDELVRNAIRVDVPGSSQPHYVVVRPCDLNRIPRRKEAEDGAGSATETVRLVVLDDMTAVVRAMKSRSEFVANASHELRTPIAAIQMAVETLSRIDPCDKAVAERFVAVIGRHAARLEGLVKDLLDLARVESPSANFERTTIHLQRMFDELRSRRAEEIEAKKLDWMAEVTPQASRLTTSMHLLSLVLDNLVDNAIKFTPSGGRISLRAIVEADRLVIEVVDTGCGIPEGDQERVFERFYQVDRARSQSGERRGTGLGLSIVRHAALAMGATVRLQSKVGQGTSVAIEFPRASEHPK